MVAVILDFDGTVVDTESTEYTSWHEVYESLGVAFPFDRWTLAVGAGSVFDPIRHLEDALGHTLDRDAILEERRVRDRELSESLPLRPGISSLIQACREDGVPLGLATNSHRRWVLPHLERLGIRDVFTAMATGDDDVPPKPEPDLYRLVLTRLGILPENAVAIEDSPNGYAAAARTGVVCVVVPNPVTARMAFPDTAPVETRVPPLKHLLALIEAPSPKG